VFSHRPRKDEHVYVPRSVERGTGVEKADTRADPYRVILLCEHRDGITLEFLEKR